MQNLNFTHYSSSATITNSYPNWPPIGGGATTETYTAELSGNGHTISNLAISGATNAGLFDTLGSGGAIRDVGLINPSVSGRTFVVSLVSRINAGGKVTASYVQGGTVTTQFGGTVAGGLVGSNIGTIGASYAYASVNGGFYSAQYLGVLVGESLNPGIITATYARGSVSGGTSISRRGGLVGTSPASIDGSHCDISAQTRPCNGWTESGTPTSFSFKGKTAAELQSPTGYTGIYALWNVDGSGDSFSDQPWDFGATSTYPVLTSPPSGRRMWRRRSTMTKTTAI